MTSKTTWVCSQAIQAVDYTSKQPIYLQTTRFSNLDRTNTKPRWQKKAACFIEIIQINIFCGMNMLLFDSIVAIACETHFGSNKTKVNSCCISSPCASLFHKSRALLGIGVRHASARTSEVQGAVSPSIARRRRRAPPAGEHRAPASTARKRGNLGRQKLTSIESRFRRMPAPAAVPQPSTTRQRGRRRQGQMRAPFFRAEAPACLPACTPPCLHALPPRARTPDLRRGPATPRVPCSAQLERRECCAARARTGRAGAGGGPAQANFSARRHGARLSRRLIAHLC